MKLIWVLVPPYWVYEHDLEGYIPKLLGAFTTYEEALTAWEKLAEYGWPATQTSIQQVVLDNLKYVEEYAEGLD